MADPPRKPKKATTGPTGLEIRLRMAFTLPSAPGVSRWPGDHPVAGATIGIEGTSISVTTDASGNATLPRAALPASPFTLKVRPDSSQLNTTGAAGPNLFKGATSLPRFAYRGFDAIASVDAAGWEVSPGPLVNAFAAASAKASAHYVIDLDGHVVKMVQEAFPAWHAGSSFWLGKKGLNQFSVGIENVHADQVGPDIHHLTPHPTIFPDDQYDSLIRLLTQLRTEFPAATRQRIVGHSDIEIQGHGHN